MDPAGNSVLPSVHSDNCNVKGWKTKSRAGRCRSVANAVIGQSINPSGGSDRWRQLALGPSKWAALVSAQTLWCDWRRMKKWQTQITTQPSRKIENPLPEFLTRMTSKESSFGVSNVHFEFICGGISLKFEYPPKQATTLTIILQFENILKY